jgi:hypothetical protein
LRSWQIASGMSSTTATGKRSCCLASSTSGPRASRCTFVASTTVKRGCASRRPAMKCRTANASSEALWSFSSSAIRPRQKSDEITSVGAKCRRANELLPEPEGPIRTTRLGSGRSILTG